MEQSEYAATTTLISHVDTNKVSREELAIIPTPGGTDTFKPVAHIELVNSLEAILNHKGIQIVKEQFAIRSDGSKLFGTFDLSLEGVGESCAAMGFRTANDRSMKIQIVAGMRVFVCDNMALSGDSVILSRKHTSGLDLLPELMGAVGRYQTRYLKFREEVIELQGLSLLDTEAKALIHDAFVKDVMPVRYLPEVSGAYFNPPHPDFIPRTAWSLHNAFTEVMKDMGLNRRMEATQALGELFGLCGGV